MTRRRADRIDENQPDIVKTLRDLGYSVETGKDDILVGHRGKTYWYEIKTEGCRSKKTGLILDSKIKPSQHDLLRNYKGHYKIVTSWEEIVEDINKGK